MINSKNNRYIVFDDGGFIQSNPDNSGFSIDYIVYERILELAKRNEIKIPIACTASFFDIDGHYDKSNVNPYVEKILKLIRDNNEYLEIWNHGLTHMYNNEYTEFWSYKNGNVPIEMQEEKIKISQKIFKELGFCTETFVPPGHAWEQNITDKIATNYGIKNIAIREFEKTSFREWMKNPFNRYKNEWNKSNYLTTFFRLGLGITHDQYHFNKKTYKKVNFYISNTFPMNIIVNRKIKLKFSIDHFFAHVQNLSDKASMEFFDFVIKKIRQKRH